MKAIHHLVNDLGKKDFLCVIVGNGDALPGLKLLAQELQITNYMLFTGWVDSQEGVARYLSSLDICAAPEPWDSFNVRSTTAKVMEYMALGKPTVAFDLPEHRFSAQNAALYARPDDVLDYARKIAVLIDDPELRKVLGQRGIERINNELAWHHQEKALLHVYDSVFVKRHY